MNEILRLEIESQLSLDTDVLLIMLGSSHALGASPETPRDGKAILKNAKKALRSQICSSENVRRAYASTENSKVLLVSAVIDCIAGAVTGVSPITVAVLLVKEGIDELCGELWSNEPRSD